MLALGVRYLNGWAMASHPADREQPEWPPHPDRLFMALAAAHFETEGDAIEADALSWLEQQAAPALSVSDHTVREPIVSYVPVNDTSAPRLRVGQQPSPNHLAAGLALLPEKRGRQPRYFPVAIPKNPIVHFLWQANPPEKVAQALVELCSKVVRIGHSASLVQVWIEPCPPEPNLAPTDGVARHRLRVIGQGRLDQLQRQFANRRRPESSLWAGYGDPPKSPQPSLPQSLFDDRLLVLRRRSGQRLGLESTLLLTETVRKALLTHCQEPVPEWISGHGPEGRPSRIPHLAFVPLADVDHEHADGHLLGIALTVPRGLEPETVGRTLNPVIGFDDLGTPREFALYAGNRFEWRVEMERRESPPMALQNRPWTRPVRQWASVTPVVFDRHPKGSDRERQAENMVADACQRIGLPRPTAVVLTDVSLHLGVPHRRAFPPLIRKSDQGRMHHTHVVLTFAQCVRGPVLIGAGRFRGYGLCRPLPSQGDAS